MTNIRQECRDNLVEGIKWIRSKAEEQVTMLIDEHMAEWNSMTTKIWADAERTSIEVDTWSERKKRMCYDQKALLSPSELKARLLNGPY